MNYCCRKELVPLINTMKHINGIDEMREYVGNMTEPELSRYGFKNTEKDRRLLISDLQNYFFDKELLLKGSVVNLGKDNIIFATKNSDNFYTYIENKLYYLSNIFTIENVKNLIKNKNFNKYKHEEMVLYVPKENVRLVCMKNEMNDFIPTFTTFNCDTGKVKCVKLTKDYIEECYSKAICARDK